MRKYHLVLASLTLLLSQPIFANHNDMSTNSGNAACDTIAKTCIAGGFNQKEYPTKRFWQDCMKPVLMNQEVVDITVDPKMAAACRAYKIQEIKIELTEFQSVKPASH